MVATPSNFSGLYTTQRDGLRYEHEGIWFRDGFTIVWRATVFRDGKLKGAIAGSIPRAKLDQPEEQVKKAIGTAIELLDGVEI